MDVAGHAITLISIIIGLGLTEMFGKLYRLIRNRRRVVWDLLPLAWVLTLFLLVLNFWWFLFLRLDAEQTATVADFAFILLPPILLFVATASVLPDFSGEQDWDMRRDYDEQRKVIILTLALYQLSTFTTALVVVGRIDWDFLSLVRIGIFALLAVLLLTKSRRWDWIAILAMATVLMFRLTTQVVR